MPFGPLQTGGGLDRRHHAPTTGKANFHTQQGRQGETVLAVLQAITASAKG
ncbi:hypothetical protein MJ560_01240 [Klebsiella pneumoniae]|nr:hypothetical protein MJ560_01240 [Klebsiella pneumoniae]